MIFDSLFNNTKNSLKILKKIYGINCNIYFPLDIQNQTDLIDENLEYNNEPDLEKKLLLPFVFYFNKSRTFVGDLYGMQDLFFYETNIDFFPMGSKIEFTFNNKIYIFRVFDFESIDVQQGTIIYRIIIVPFNTVEPTELFLEKIYDEREDLLQDKFINNEQKDIILNNKELEDIDEDDLLKDKSTNLSFGKLIKN